MTDPRPFPMRRSCPFLPPAEYAEMRARGPVTKVALPTGRTAWAITGYNEVRAVLADRRISSDVRHPNFPSLVAGEQEVASRVRPFLRMDPPEHTGYRRMLVAEMTMRRARVMRRAVQRIVDERIDDLLRDGGPVDLVSQFAGVVSTTVMGEMIGLRRTDPWFRKMTAALGSQHIGGADSDATSAATGLETLFEVFGGLVTERERNPGDDLLSKLIVDHYQQGTLSRDDLLATVTITVIAGMETTTSQISLSVLTLLENPDLLAQLRADHTVLPGAVDELLRVLSVGDSIALRVATADVEIAGTTIRAGDGVIPLLAAANHDPAVFDEPDRIDAQRSARTHVAFGSGAHQCVGQNLARVELEVALGTLFDRIPNLRLAAVADELEFRHGGISFGPIRLPVTW
ncbi:cytochrome P450 [Nocardia donostiensis]|uniref:Cytochrome n=1 Tax=Nocardia donostiensis TaxID=1538463 RepID=A0A1V2T9Y9_9NOCA|nr:cytochrome P450 [Nocardia donostiensis]ONM46310.1 cytochrome [Nocardia donostiensis]OQS13379.1 cytochrome [Nocardia donostiensis]OQS18575.1 cytochrome [Nocardia donostiensis]